MGYKGHPGWTDGDVGNVPDENPLLDCAGCDASKRYQSMTDDDGWVLPETPDDPILCPDCAAEPTGTRTVEERREANHSLDTFTDGGRDALLERVEDAEFSNPAFKGAYRKGVEAALDGRERTANPYDPDNYGPQGVTFSRAFWRHWNKGYDDAERYQRREGE